MSNYITTWEEYLKDHNVSNTDEIKKYSNVFYIPKEGEYPDFIYLGRFESYQEAFNEYYKHFWEEYEEIDSYNSPEDFIYHYIDDNGEVKVDFDMIENDFDNKLTVIENDYFIVL